VNFPLGHQTGKKFEPDLQKAILKDALNALTKIQEPGTVMELPYRWADDDTWEKEVAL